MKVAFTGHRPDKLGGYNLESSTVKFIKQEITSVLRQLSPARGITGMALGVDQLAAEIMIDLGIPFTAAVPFKHQDAKWPEESKKRYHKLLAFADKVVNVSGKLNFMPEYLQMRNEWMVDQLRINSDALIAVWDGSSGGTANCVHYARSKGVKIIRINPYKNNVQDNSIPMKDDSFMPFGKYAGKKMIDVPEQYLVYIYDNKMIPAKHSAVKDYIENNVSTISVQVGKYKRH